jgi:hypothetical protein
MTKEELVKAISGAFVEVLEGEKDLTVNVKEGIEKDSLLTVIKEIFDYETETKEIVYLNLKGLNVSLITEAIRYSLTREDLRNPYMILNIINLIKIYNTLDDSFFNDSKIYVNSIEDLLDVKLDLTNELKKFQRQLSIYFISLFKSYNKFSYEPLDKHIELPEIYKNIILSLDILTLSGIFSVSEPFSTEECVYIDSAIIYMNELLMRGAISTKLFSSLFGENNDSNNGK